jgi:hypothetical protein
VVRQLFALDVAGAEVALAAAGFSESEILAASAFHRVQQFSPVLMFDRAQDGYPMSAQTFFDLFLCGARGGPVCTASGCDYTGCQLQAVPWGIWNIGPLQAGTVPTYFKVTSCSPGGQLRIHYWWFYGHQPPCLASEGEHVADWEHVMVTTTADRTGIAAVTYFQHYGWYTLMAGRGGFETLVGRPVVYVGKKSHGAYHDSGGIGGCGYFDDYRNPASFQDAWFTHSNLKSMTGNSESWMIADRNAGAGGTASWTWGYASMGHGGGVSNHPSQVGAGPSCSFRACRGDNTTGLAADAGCARSQCLTTDTETGLTGCRQDCPTGWTDCGFACVHSTNPAECINPFADFSDPPPVIWYDFHLPTTDSGLR